MILKIVLPLHFQITMGPCHDKCREIDEFIVKLQWIHKKCAGLHLWLCTVVREGEIGGCFKGNVIVYEYTSEAIRELVLGPESK